MHRVQQACPRPLPLPVSGGAFKKLNHLHAWYTWPAGANKKMSHTSTLASVHNWANQPAVLACLPPMTMSRNTAHVLLQCQQVLENFNQRIHVDWDQKFKTHFTQLTYYIYVTASKESMNQEHDARLPKPSFLPLHESIGRLVLSRFLSTLSFSYS